MKPITVAFILSIALHLLAFYTLKEKKLQEYSDKPSTSKEISKSQVHFVKLQRKAPVQKNVQKKFKTPVIKKLPTKPVKPKKLKSYKKVKKVVKTAKRKVIKKPAKNIQRKPIEKVEATPNYQKMNPTKLQKRTLDEFLAAPVLDMQLLDEVTQSYLKLYGEEYNSFTKVQKVYLQNNLKNIGRITQKYLSMPRIAVQLNLRGRHMNIVEFILHPNGDISRLKITSPSGYSFFDKETLETIEIAYKDYPRPKDPTKIKIYVNYILY